MFKQAAFLWQHLIASPSTRAAAGATEQENRRVWVRYPARTAAQVKTTAEEGALVNAKVLDVSLGGVKLQVPQHFEIGALLSLDLPGEDEASSVSVLACVVRTLEQPNGEWILGCNFSRELTAEDLLRFGISKVKPDRADQRGSLRFECNVQAFYEVTTADTTLRCAAQVVNLSACGVALLVENEVANGAMLSVDLLKSNGERVTSILACVVHIAALPDGKRILGCNFIRALSDQHLNALLNEQVVTTEK